MSEPETVSLQKLRVAIVGLGLIGGSLARALKSQAKIASLIACDRDEEVLRLATIDGTADEVLLLPSTPVNETDFSRLNNMDIVFVCTPAETVAPLVNRIALFCDGILTDAASTKLEIFENVEAKRYIGGHPMAGSERVGYAASAAGLFENAIYVICPPPAASIKTTADVALISALVRAIGAIPLCLTPTEHDQAVAAISHMPHIAAAALCLLADRSEDPLLSQLAAGGFRDITRIASSSPDLWTSICFSARPALLPVLHQYLDLIAEFTTALETGEKTALRRLFAAAAAYRDALPIDGRGALEALSSLTVRLPDRPGELGRITTLLGEQGINIRNIHIRDARSYAGGALQLMFPDTRQALAASAYLKEAGYDVD